jgi:hypothetical protein
LASRTGQARRILSEVVQALLSLLSSPVHSVNLFSVF